ncbi:DExH-box ATP-dependent RNA helicase DExH8 [Juglans microcarpa x Juglans regia]|uniref:DExH-box ATP-dependent RNA helicase DExH8 n=1 Tax=Juglans microcarpa x Juglans regia TaxID=2249226 RepID=UPI001B7F212B|nr:DExH-box ATP-dependent RNA helicase DExH8 [Juglans microcarpa x Juglans regia]
MASPTSSCSSSYSSPFSSSKFSSLPVMSLRGKIVEKIIENRVTLIVGETGCGKSSQVPQFLLEEGMEPILCTQPRRFAVVAVAKMVAKARNCEVGGEVGYHIGHSKHLSPRSRIVFKTAGVLLDELREKGMNALKYKVIILDEVHERSIESDLVLVCLKQFLIKNNDLRVVLMSATADITRYKDYFKDLGRGERVEVLAIPMSNHKTIFQQSVSYLEQITELLGISSELLSSTYSSGPSPSMANANIKPAVHKLIHNLILHIHENEPDIEKSILVFLPTYYSLEQQWKLLTPLSSSFKVHILHSSIDTEQALMAMKILKSHRKIILATNIAESSVTIPKVAFVIDSCRSLQVFWDSNRKKDSTELVWVSKSQAEQRRGRTGRTCDGQVYRLVTSSFFSQLKEFEPPSILRLSLRQQVLLISCAESKAINDPKALLQKALDPPNIEVVEDALSLLVHMHALEKTSPRGRYEPTFYGRLLASFSLSFDAAVLILKFGDIGMLREGIVLGILMDTQPLPILHPFGEEDLFTEYLDCYFGGESYDKVLPGRKEVIFMGNLCAFQFWQRVFKDKHRLEHLKQLLKFNDVKAATSLLPSVEEEWCSFHNLAQSSLRHVSEIYEDVLSSVHRFRPKLLATSNGMPLYYDPYEFEHTCLLKFHPDGDTDEPPADDEPLHPSNEIRKCLAVPYVASHNFQNSDVVEKLVATIKEIKVLYTEDKCGNQQRNVDVGSHVNGEAPICVFFINGSCNKGSQCLFSHSLKARRPICKFFFSLQGCRNGGSCVFSHDLGPSVSSSSTLCLPEDGDANAASLIRLFPISSNGCILLLDDMDLHFSSNLAGHYNPSKIISTTCLSDTFICNTSLTGVRILWGLKHPYETLIAKAGENLIPWKDVKCVLWFPNFDGNDENLDGQKAVLQNFFEYLAIRILANALYEVQVILTLNNVRFSQLQVERLGNDCFFFLTESFPFDETSFGKLSDPIITKKPMLVSRPISYVFDLHPPSDIQFGNYAATLQKGLHDI